MIGTWKIVLIGAVILLLIIGYFSYSKPIWIGFFYSDKSNLFEYRQSPALSTVDECREWARNQATLDRDGNSDYECGKNCRANGDGPLICDETLR